MDRTGAPAPVSLQKSPPRVHHAAGIFFVRAALIRFLPAL